MLDAGRYNRMQIATLQTELQSLSRKVGRHEGLNAELREALLPYTMDISPWPEKYAMLSRHELLEMAIVNYPWQTFLLYTICGATTDDNMPKFRIPV